MVLDGHGDSNLVVDYVLGRFPVVLSDTLRDADGVESLQAGLKKAFFQLDNEVRYSFRNAVAGGCVCGMLIKFNDPCLNGSQYLMVQCGDLNLLAVTKDGQVVLQMPVHAHSNATEVKRVGQQHILFNQRLFGVLEPFRGFGNYDLQGPTVKSWGKEWVNAQQVYRALPEIRILTEDEVCRTDYFVVASDGLLDTRGKTQDRDFKEEFQAEVPRQDWWSDEHVEKRRFVQMVEKAKRVSADDVSLVVVRQANLSSNPVKQSCQASL
jgi:serine/threonine protein phosphatase PrpC